jgi:hypothetical protein
MSHRSDVAEEEQATRMKCARCCSNGDAIDASELERARQVRKKAAQPAGRAVSCISIELST